MKNFLKMFALAGFTGVCSMLLFGRDVNAYIDPSVMTYVIQAVAGVVIAVGAVAGIYIRRAKKKLNDKLGIDENRNKEVESDEIVIEKTTKE
mgnify:CR=1 FL=1|jgi:hypothetical protein